MLEVKLRAATARTGVFRGDGWELPIPNILFPESARLEAPGYAGGVLKENEEGLFIEIGENKIALPPYSGIPAGHKPGNCETPDYSVLGNVAVIRPDISDEDIAGLLESTDIFVLENALELYQNPFRFVNVMTHLRQASGYQKILYLPGAALPQNLAVLFYMGADILDAAGVVFLTRKKMFLTPDGAMASEDVDPEACACRGCDLDASANEKLLAHNLLAMQTELQQIRGRIAQRSFRQFVEYRAKTSPELVSMLRLMDHNYSDFQEERFPVTGPGFKATTRLSIDRPDVKRFRERVLTRYWKPSDLDILVILPCSARKPYSKSRSHQKFREAIKTSGAAHRVHELIITSPLGLVPRELELVYPAQHYDIPVTGHWYEDEKKMIDLLLKDYLAINKYEHVIVHMEPELFEGLDAEFTVDERPTDAQSLVNLQEVLSRIGAGDKRPDWKKRTIDEMTSIARFQWGEDATDLFQGCNVRGRYPILRIKKGSHQLAMVSEASGFLTPTLELGKLMADRELYWVKMHEFDLVGNLFAVGVEDADPRIRVGDEVCIVGEKGLVATGTAKMSACEMVESKKGEAVRVRHKRK